MALFVLGLFSSFPITAQVNWDNDVANCAHRDFSQYFGREDGAFGHSILHVDLRDVVEYNGELFPEALNILERLTVEDTGHLPLGVHYSPRGPTRGHNRNQVYGIEITRCPTVLRKSVEFHLQMFYHRWGQLRRQLFVATLDRDTSHVSRILMYKNHEWADRNLRLELSLLERKAIVMDNRGRTFKIYPVAVGGLDEAVTSEELSITTPFYTEAYLNEAVSQAVRWDPPYYKGMPFLRISHSTLDWTPIGFHIRQNPRLKRGFESHGCIRMREKDLYELYWLLKSSPDGTMPLGLVHWSQVPWDHPYPLEDKSYMAISHPPRRGEDGLLVMERGVLSSPPRVLWPLRKKTSLSKTSILWAKCPCSSLPLWTLKEATSWGRRPSTPAS